MKRKLIYAVDLAALSATAIGGAYAAKSSENDTLAISTAKVGLAQAVTAAEGHVGGKASRAKYEWHKGAWVFDVEVVKGNTVTDIVVDAGSGKVISAWEDKADQDDEHDKED